MPLDIEKIVKRYQDNMGSASTKQKYKDKVEAVTESPAAKAATPEAEQLYLNGVQESVASGKRRRKLLEVTLESWKEATIKKGAERLATGATAALSKVRAHFQRFAPVYERVKSEVRAMPKGGRENAKARAARAIEILMDAAGRT